MGTEGDSVFVCSGGGRRVAGAYRASRPGTGHRVRWGSLGRAYLTEAGYVGSNGTRAHAARPDTVDSSPVAAPGVDRCAAPGRTLGSTGWRTLPEAGECSSWAGRSPRRASENQIPPSTLHVGRQREVEQSRAVAVGGRGCPTGPEDPRPAWRGRCSESSGVTHASSASSCPSPRFPRRVETPAWWARTSAGAGMEGSSSPASGPGPAPVWTNSAGHGGGNGGERCFGPAPSSPCWPTCSAPG